MPPRPDRHRRTGAGRPAGAARGAGDAGPADALGAGEWAVLGLVGEGPTHGFAVAGLLAADGDLGRIWMVARPAVYQAINKLTALGLVRAATTERSRLGPNRTIVELSDDGRRALDDWLGRPVAHVRDLRSVLLLKLALGSRLGTDPGPLLAAQRAVLVAGLRALEERRLAGRGDDRMIATWRLSAHRAALDFVDTMTLDGEQPPA